MNQSPREQLRNSIKGLVDARNDLAERIDAELEFAEALAGLRPAQAKRWGTLIDQAAQIVSKTIAAGKLDRLAKAVKQAEEILSPIGKVAKQYTAHCVGHAHIDMNWMWAWPETVAVTNDTFLTVLDLMEEFDDFCLTQSQVSVYEIVREHHPELFERIKRRVAEGRWEIAAAHWVEGDKNLVTGESLARHMLYSRSYMKEHFDLDPEQLPLDWEPDTFGHAATIPSIVSKGAVRHYYMCRGGSAKKPSVFRWIGPDGSSILVNISTTWYIGAIDPHCSLSLVKFCERSGLKDWLNVYGVGDHGGGPTRRDIVRCRDMDGWPIFPNFKLTTTRRYYKILERCADKLPEFRGELNFEFTGCYSSQARVKQAVAVGEQYCLEAEVAATLAHRALGHDYPAEKIREAWVNILFGHFHDILPGSGVAATREYQLGLFQKTGASTSIIKMNSLRALASRVDTSFACQTPTPAATPAREPISMGGGVGRGVDMGGFSTSGHVSAGPRGLVVFNPTAWLRSDVVKATVWDAETDPDTGGWSRKRFVVRTPDGKETPAQRLGEGAYWGHNFVDLALPTSVGPMGYAACGLLDAGLLPEKQWRPGMIVEEKPSPGAVRMSAGFRGNELQPEGRLAMENDHLAVEFDRSSGGITKLLDKSTGIDLADPESPLGVLEYILERPRGMSSWLIGDIKRRVCPLDVEKLSATQRGPHVGSVEAQARINGSQITVTYTLKAGAPWLEIDFAARWVEIGGPEVGIPTLRMQFPLAVRDASARYETPFGSIERDLNSGQEVPALHWADVTGKAVGANRQAGCTLLNDCKHGHSLDDATLRLTLLRSSYEPDPLPEVGEHTARLALVPHGKRPATGDLRRLGAALSQPLQVIPTDIHEGDLPTAASAVSVARPDSVVITAVKKAEKDDAVIIHLLETAGRKSTTNVTLDEKLIGKATRAMEVDLLERPLATSTAKATDAGFAVDIPAHGIVGVQVAF